GNQSRLSYQNIHRNRLFVLLKRRAVSHLLRVRERRYRQQQYDRRDKINESVFDDLHNLYSLNRALWLRSAVNTHAQIIEFARLAASTLRSVQSNWSFVRSAQAPACRPRVSAPPECDVPTSWAPQGLPGLAGAARALPCHRSGAYS